MSLPQEFLKKITEAGEHLATARPTAVSLPNSVNYVLTIAGTAVESGRGPQRSKNRNNLRLGRVRESQPRSFAQDCGDKLIRPAGGDQLYSGSGAGRMGDKREEMVSVATFPRQPWDDVKTVFPVASEGICPGVISDDIHALGADTVIIAGGGIQGHPQATRAGAAAMGQAIYASIAPTSLGKYAKTNAELSGALAKWATPSYQEK